MLRATLRDGRLERRAWIPLVPWLVFGAGLGLFTAWIAPHATELHADVDIHLKALAELPAHCERLFA